MRNRVFISYRRDDASGYAGRLEEALERRLGPGSAFRDVLDIAPGADFVAAIQERLAGAQTVLVLIGPRWAGVKSDGSRRIDDPQDFVRLEVSAALQSAARVVPVLLPDAVMPLAADLPQPLQPLARRNAMTLGDTHWDADIERLVGSLGSPPPPGGRRWLLGGLALAAAAVALALTWAALRPSPPSADAAAWLAGVWQADVRYGWGDRHTERFDFKRHAGAWTGTASFLAYPRAIEMMKVDGANLHFQTHSEETVGDTTKQLTHAYAAERRGPLNAPVLMVRMVTSGGYSSQAPIEFEARRPAP